MKPIILATTNLFIALTFIITSLPAICAADTQVSLQWDRVQPAPQGYRLYQRTEGKSYNYQQYTDTGTANNHVVEGLSENTTYYFVVRSYTGSNVSNDSNEAVFTSTAPATSDTNPPSQPFPISPTDNPLNISLRPLLKSSNFYDPDTNDQHVQSRWRVYRMDGGSMNDDTLVLDRTSRDELTQITVPADVLDHFTPYYWTVNYTNQRGATSPPSPPAHFSTQGDQGAGSNTAATSSNLGGSDSNGWTADLGAGCWIQTLMPRLNASK